jgi:hypothetical protein
MDETGEPTPAESAPVDPFIGAEWIGKYALGGSAGRTRRVSERSRTRRRRQRRAGWVLLGLGGLMVITAGWILVTGLLARSQLSAMKTELPQLRADISAGHISDAGNLATKISRQAHRAHELTTGPAWWGTAAIPGVGDPVRTVRGISASADAIGAHSLKQLVDVSGAIDPTRLTVRNHTIDVSRLIAAIPELDAAVAAADRQQRVIAALPRDTWLPSLNKNTNQVVVQLAKLTGSLQSIDHAAHAVPTMLGYSSPQRYFVAFQNDAESRGTGGLPGAFGILVADHGKLTFTHFESDSYLDGVDSGLALNSQYTNTWRSFGPTQQYLNSDVDPDFRYAGQIWAAMWQKKSGEHVDGAISLDPTALSYLLAVTGPAALPDGTHVTSTNIVALSQSTVYTKFPTDEAARKSYLLQIAQAADKRILNSAGDAGALYQAASRAASERRLLLWDANSSVESLLANSTIGGTVSNTTAPYVGPVIVDYSANKLDYYLASNVSWVGTGCGQTQDVTVTIKLTNGAPANLPKYVYARTDDPSSAVKPGDNRIMLYYIATIGTTIGKMTINGRQVVPRTGIDGTHPTYAELVELPRGTTQTVVLHLTEPASSAKPVVLHQPMVIPGVITTRTAAC